VSITVEMLAQEFTALKQLTRLEHDAEATIQAARELLRLCRLRESKGASGNVEFDLNWQARENFELRKAIP
jgi:hypothetical protein